MCIQFNALLVWQLKLDALQTFYPSWEDEFNSFYSLQNHWGFELNSSELNWMIVRRINRALESYWRQQWIIIRTTAYNRNCCNSPKPWIDTLTNRLSIKLIQFSSQCWKRARNNAVLLETPFLQAVSLKF